MIQPKINGVKMVQNSLMRQSHMFIVMFGTWLILPLLKNMILIRIAMQYFFHKLFLNNILLILFILLKLGFKICVV